MRQTTNKNLTKQILTLALAFVMVFTGMGIGSWGVDTAWADTSDYEIKLGQNKLTSSYYSVDNTEHSLNKTLTVNKTFILRFQVDTDITFINAVGYPIPNIGVYSFAGEKGFSMGKGKTKDLADVKSTITVTKEQLLEKGYTVDQSSTAFYYVYFDWAGTKKNPIEMKYAVLIEITPNGTKAPASV